jgi:surfeit locus 1 family protein
MALVALVIVVACLLLGRWQLGRVYRPSSGYLAEPAAVQLTTLVPMGDPIPQAVIGRQVTVFGRYVRAGQVVVPGHVVGGQPVSWVVTPLLMPDRTEVLVVRGWVGPGARALAAPPARRVTVTGRIEDGVVLPPASPATHGPIRLHAGYLIRTAQSPPDPLSLQPAPAAGPATDQPREFHLQNAVYVVQWFLLALVVIVSWWRLHRLRRRIPSG